MARYLVVWFDVVGGNYTIEVEGWDRIADAVRRAEELGGIWFPAGMAGEVIKKIKEAMEE